ncbi:FRG domain-containing protein [Caldisalinibacter kiritimatiensis]|uniref:FRG domain-containing protein n=1 Tax=Caldisalinibacter kiritimatiensis TaxID=1304284 RepID=R1ARS3_9FIRM|nr:FRG domain-containing protein [Caldisalinibacter kiritimatiensis]EOC99366.1 hypothetical protein L21TH_2624 [Caldisalinibacter kiritimatiensis]
MIKYITDKELRELRQKNEQHFRNIEAATKLRREAMKSKTGVVGNNFWSDFVAEQMNKGSIIQYPHGRVMCFGEASNYYRGQLKDYGSCKPTLFRGTLTESKEMILLKKFVSGMQIIALNKLIEPLHQVRSWKFGDIFTYMIAQHYGIRTKYLDITSNMEVALFFATCMHIGNNRYRPITEEDIESNIGKEGMIYWRIGELDYIEAIENRQSIYPIGYQPFSRCHKQYGYFMVGNENFDLNNEPNFNIYYFNRTPNLSKEIYEKFDGGKTLFEYDALAELKDMLDSIQSTKFFSEEVFEETVALEEFSVWDKDRLIKELNNQMGISIGGNSIKLSRQRRRAIDRKWSIESFVEKEGLAPGYRMVYTSPKA